MNRVEKLLRDWAKKRDSKQQTLEDLTGDIMARIENLPHPETVPVEDRGEIAPYLLPRPVSWERLALAAVSVCLIIVICYHAFFAAPDQVARPQPQPQPQGQSSASWLQVAGLPEDAKEKNTRIYDEFSRLFPGQIKWIQQTNGEINFELLSAEQTVSSKDEYVMVRFVVLKEGQGGVWQKQQVTDITAASEEVVQIPLKQLQGDMQFWIHRLPDGHFALDTEVISEQAAKGLASYEGIMKSGQSEVVFEMEGQDAKYKVVQTIRRICRINEKDCS